MENLIQFLHIEEPLLVDFMKTTKHSSTDSTNPYHLEDSVWAHTMLCCKTLEIMFKNIESDNYKLLKFATLLHDIGKIYCREEVYKDNITKVRFLNHASYSFFKSIDILNKTNLSSEDKKQILSIIALHMDFKNWADENNIFNVDKVSSKLKNNIELFDDLIKMSIIDNTGRFCFHEHYGKAYDSNNILDCIYGLNEEKSNPIKEKTITLLIGLPCSGKTTWIKNNIKSEDSITIISRDDIIHQFCGENYNEAYRKADHKKVDGILSTRFKEAVKKHDNIVVDMTNLSKKRRNKFLNNLPEIYNKKAILFATGVDACKLRNNRENKIIPLNIFHDMQKSFSFPLYDQFNEIEWVF